MPKLLWLRQLLIGWEMSTSVVVLVLESSHHIVVRGCHTFRQCLGPFQVKVCVGDLAYRLDVSGL